MYAINIHMLFSVDMRNMSISKYANKMLISEYVRNECQFQLYTLSVSFILFLCVNLLLLKGKSSPESP